MKKRYIITLLFLWQFSFFYAQDKEAILTDCIFEYAYFYTKKSNGEKEKKAYNEVLKDFFENPEDNKKKQDIIDVLKQNEFEELSKGLETTFNKSKLEDINNSKSIINLFFKNIKEIYEETDASDLRKKLIERYESPNEKAETGVKAQKKERLNNKTTKQSSLPHIGIILAVLLSIISTVLTGLFYFLLKKKNVKLEKELSSVKKLQNNFNKNCNNILITRKEFSHKISSIEDKISDLNKSIEELQVNNSTNYSHPNNLQSSNIPKIEKVDFLYTSYPKNGVFSSVSKEKTDNIGFYKFSIKDENNMVEFEFNSDGEYFSNAMYNPESFLNPACTALNQYNKDAKKIVTVKKGIAIKEGDKWVVQQKAEIRYE